MSKITKWANYPTLNARSDIFFVMEQCARRIGCDNLRKAMSVVFYKKNSSGFIVGADLGLRDGIVSQVLEGLRESSSPFKMTLNEWDYMVELCVTYEKLLRMQRMTNEFWDYIYNLLRHEGFYLTFSEAKEKGLLRLMELMED